ncbi:MAG: hypothetical protein QW057_01730 [Candidatus Bathyarchaeia archaeon]
MSWNGAVTGALAALSKDQLAKMLLKESHLTERQLSAILIDILAEELAQNSVKYEEKARSMPKPESRGAYNRTLTQARRNVIRSFFTLYLLGYMGLLSLPELAEHMKLGEALKSYVDSYLQGRPAGMQQTGLVESIRKHLLERLSRLVQPSSLRPASKL